jgi:beta-galactosidase
MRRGMRKLRMLLLASAVAAAAAGAAEAAAVSPQAGRTTSTLTHGWKFQLGDLPFTGPALCADDLGASFPLSLTGKECSMGPRDAWSRITVGGDTDLPGDCARACCSSNNCSMWTYYNGSTPCVPPAKPCHTHPDRCCKKDGTTALLAEAAAGGNATGGSHEGPLGPAGSFRTRGACVLGYGAHDTATDCTAEGGAHWLGAARALPVAPRPPPPPVADGAEAEGFDDSGWRSLSIPHDFVIEGVPCVAALGCENPLGESDFMHGSYPKGVGWYRRTFAAPSGGADDVTWLHFEGILNDAMVFVNGKFLARRFGSYSGFSVELPPSLLTATNTLAVRCDSRTNEGWFYEGGGLHRLVHLVSAGSVHVAEHGVYVVSTPLGSLSGATVAPTDLAISTEVLHSGTARQAALARGGDGGGGGGGTMTLHQEVIDAATQEVVQKASVAFSVDAGANQTLDQAMHLPSAKLWSVDTPNLYILRTQLLRHDAEGEEVAATAVVLDAVNVTFGVRRAVFDVDNGFSLNDVKTQIKGFCLHETFGGTGSAIPPIVNDFRIAKLKEMGTNAWRGAHEPVAESLFDSADRMGMLMWVENREFGQETDGYTPEDTITSNVEAMVRRSRNHPSIILWSLCNEGGCIQRSAEQAVRKGNAAKSAIHALDRTRPMTAALNFGASGKECEWDCLSPTLEVVGVNYNWQDWDAFHANNTNQPMVSSEMTRSNSVRGIYASSPKALPTKGYASVYSAAPGYVNTWRQVNSRREWLAGGFLWTGIDYLGEPDSPVSISSSFGAVDVSAPRCCRCCCASLHPAQPARCKSKLHNFLTNGLCWINVWRLDRLPALRRIPQPSSGRTGRPGRRCTSCRATGTSWPGLTSRSGSSRTTRWTRWC